MHAGSIYTDGGYFLSDDIHGFDSAFFQLPENDAMAMDPQQKLLLENVYHALENAGISLKDIASSKTSVYVGCSNVDALALSNSDPLLFSQNQAAGTSPAILANRISWFFDLQGTSQTIDTACSSSLVAFHQACQNIKSGDSDMAIISGVNLVQHPSSTQNLCSLGVLSPEGQCLTFDERANGYGRGEGVGTVIIKPLHAAIRDSNPIRAVVRGTGSNQDGKTAGITLPSARAQESLIRQVYASYNLDMADTSYVEAHGTATLVGDPLELTAITSAFDCERDSDIYVGSVKSVIGHLEGGAGIAGLITATLAIESKMIPPVANLQNLNPAIPAANHVKISKECLPWPSNGVRRASVNSFGFGGTNAHVVLEDLDGFMQQKLSQQNIQDMTGRENSPGLTSTACLTNGSARGHTNGRTPSVSKRVLALTAFDEEGINRNRMQLSKYLASLSDLNDESQQKFLDDLLYTMNEKRTSFSWRTYCLVGDNLGSVITSLSQGLRPTRASVLPKITRFVFTGQGANWPGMAQDLREFPLFKQRIAEATMFFKSLGAPWDLQESLASLDFDIAEPSFAQSSCVAVQVALVDLLTSWKILPATVVGHSSGEIAAAYCAGKISRQAAWKVAFHRGQVCSQKADGSGTMLAAAIAVQTAEELLARLKELEPLDVTIGCFNSPKNVTFTGKRAGIARLQQELDRMQVFNRALPVKVAYHSPDLQDVADEYLASLGDLDFGDKINEDATIQMYSSVTGKPFGPADKISPSYWVENLVSPVRFSTALLRSFGLQQDRGKHNQMTETIIEIGPHSALRSAIKDTLDTSENLRQVGYSSLMKRNETTGDTLMHTMGSLYSSGYDIDLPTINNDRKSAGSAAEATQILRDLPPYAFGHTSKRMTSRQIEFVKFPEFQRHELLGMPTVDSNPFEQRWRNSIRLQDVPWLSSNKLNDKVIFPGVAYISMAVEAALLASRSEGALAGVELRDVSIRESLLIPDNPQGIETIFSLSRSTSGSDASSPWSTFRFISHNDIENTWVEHCSGSIRVEKDKSYTPQPTLSKELDNATRSPSAQQEYFTRTIEGTLLYEEFASAGMTFGSDLQNMQEIQLSTDAKAFASLVRSPDIPKKAHDHYVIHPCALESILHGLLCICSEEGSLVGGTMVANRVERIWIADPLTDIDCKVYSSFAEARRETSTLYRSNIEIYEKGASETPRMAISGFDLVSLPPPEDEQASDEALYVEEWKPDVKMLSSIEKFDVKAKPVVDLIKAVAKSDHELFQLASAVFILDTVEKLDSINIEGLPSHLISYVKWIREQFELISQGNALILDVPLLTQIRANTDMRQNLLDKTSKSAARGELLVRIGTRIESILRQESDGLELMFGADDIMTRTYDECLPGDMGIRLWQYFHCLAHNQSGLKVLEVGGGTGSATNIVLDALKSARARDNENGVHPVAIYDFTDISAAFFENARERFSDWNDVMRYKTLDVEKDPALQDYEIGSYDLIIATHVLHATADLGGDLILIENVNPELMSASLIFGILSGWWRSTESFRQSNPLITEHQWNSALSNAGFTPRLHLPTTVEAGGNEISAIIARAKDDTASPESRPRCTILYDSTHETQNTLAEHLLKTLEYQTSLVNFSDISPETLTADFYIPLFFLGGLKLSNVTEVDFYKLKLVLDTCTKVLWVMDDPVDDPETAMCIGLIRTIKWERDPDGVNFTTLTVRQPLPEVDALASEITYLAKEAYNSPHIVPRNVEYSLKDGVFLTSRLLPAPSASKAVIKKKEPNFEHARLSDIAHPVALTLMDPHKPQSLQFVDDASMDGALGDNEVVIKVNVTALTPEDVEEVVRLIPGQGLGRSCAGTVQKIGQTVTNVTVGDRVVAIRPTSSTGSIRTHFRTHHNAVQRIPDSVSLSDAATLPWAFLTAYYCLLRVAHLQPEETVMIQDADKPVGQVAIQLALSTQAKLLVTVSTNAAKNSLASSFKVDPSCIFSSEDMSSIPKAVGSDFGSRGVDVYLNCGASGVSGLYQQYISYGTRLVDLFGDETTSGSSLNAFCTRNVSYTCVDMDVVATMRAEIVQEALTTVSSLLATGKLQPIQDVQNMGFSEIQKALVQCRDRSSKPPSMFVFSPEDNETVPIGIRPIGNYRFPENASYLLIGGFGGIGRRVSSWMQSRGARNFIFLSRSGYSGPSARKLRDEVTALGCTVESVQCDASDAEAVRLGLEKVQRTMPPIKGCIQCSMVLQDSMFDNMSWNQFQDATTPKVAGSINVADNIPRDLDFFVLLSSSASTIGNRGQANYAAGNAFLDAYARKLTRLGRPTTSISLGTVLSVGWVAENQGALPIALSYSDISEDRLLSLLEYHIDPRWGAAKNPDTCHTITGLRSAAEFEECGITLPEFMAYPLFTHLRNKREARSKKTEDSITTAQSLELATSDEERADLVVDAIISKISRVMAMSPENLEPQRALVSYGVDSLVTVDVKAWFKKELGATVSTQDLIGELTIYDLAQKVVASTHVPMTNGTT
ncbi:uncharacterized protein JN550_003157 [Neoarthrinium moseri]|uniref:uncharacterized protein n=1 Tax=Neoarthrinium moseri TaxID=1658444 RepID=UPI001FDB2F7D|nr:uncharacterized protein JN550_003157 [Neoarthrinium moseri]KAI1873888.1 hypothetical protein JN550_003157 [Neoarthrinium moseri]